MISSKKYRNEIGATKLAALLTTINSNPTKTNFRLGQIIVLNAFRMLTFLSAIARYVFHGYLCSNTNKRYKGIPVVHFDEICQFEWIFRLKMRKIRIENKNSSQKRFSIQFFVPQNHSN